jgi:hypothetical protein
MSALFEREYQQAAPEERALGMSRARKEIGLRAEQLLEAYIQKSFAEYADDGRLALQTQEHLPGRQQLRTVPSDQVAASITPHNTMPSAPVVSDKERREADALAEIARIHSEIDETKAKAILEGLEPAAPEVVELDSQRRHTIDGLDYEELAGKAAA